MKVAEKEPGVLTPEELLKVDLGDTLLGAEGQGGGPLLVAPQLGVVLRAQDDGFLEVNGQGVDVVEGKVEHDPPGHE